MTKRRGTQHLKRKPKPASGPSRPDLGRCACGEPAATICPDCGPQCVACFMSGAVIGGSLGDDGPLFLTGDDDLDALFEWDEGEED